MLHNPNQASGRGAVANFHIKRDTTLASGLVFLHQNGIAVDDPDERLYEVMIKIATKAIDKPEIASMLRSLIAPAFD